MIALITGGSGCGKSFYAEKLLLRAAARGSGPLYYLATMQVYDEESERRVRRHRAQRADKGFTTVEREKDLASLSLAPGRGALLECLPTLLSNELFSAGDPGGILPGIRRLSETVGNLVIVTNEVGAEGLRAYSESVKDYVKRLAALNRAVAEAADLVIEVVYGCPVAVKGVIACPV